MRDLASQIAPSVNLGPAVLSDDSTPAAMNFDLFNSDVVLIAVGVGGITFDSTNKLEFVMTHSDDGTTYTAVTSSDVRITTEAGTAGSVATGGIVLSLTAAHAAAGVTEVSYIGGKKFQKVLADFSGTHGTGTPICIIQIKGHPKYGPG